MTETLDAPLAAFHRRLGARLAPYRGVEAPAAYGDEVAEYTALREACGLVDGSWMDAIEMLGEDRARFLHGLVTCDVQGLAPGGGVYGFVTSVKGRVLADPVVLALDDRLWLTLPPATASEIAEHLRKYVIVDRVEIRSLEGVIPLSLIGPRSEEVLSGAAKRPEDVAQLPRDVFAHREATLCGAEIRLVREPPLDGVPAWSLRVRAGDAGPFCERLLEHGAAHGLRPVGHRALDRLRVEASRPLFGLDFGPDNFPQETGLEETAVSYTKGCYLGQEVVARIHYRGGVNRHLRGLVFADDFPAHASVDENVGRSLLADGREAGTLSSATDSKDGSLIGLAILHRRVEPGAELEIEGGGKARVVELPFAGTDSSSRGELQ